MHIDPYVAVDGVPFTIRETELRARLGEPREAVRNGIGLRALDYGDAVYRFQDCGRLEEVTRRAPVVQLGAVALPFAALADFVSATDPGRFERAGFVVSPRWGIAFVPDEDRWVTALARHCIDSWRAL